MIDVEAPTGATLFAAARQRAALPCTFGADGRLQVLLVTSRRSGRWIIPKGWHRGDEPPHIAAAREAYEEAGVHGCIAEAPVGTYAYNKRLESGRRLLCTVDVYALAVEGQFDDWPERSERDCLWLSPHEAAARIGDEGLRPILQRLDRLLSVWSVEPTA